MFRELVEGTDDLVVQVDSSGKILYVNRACEKVLGLAREECVGRCGYDLMGEEDRLAIAEIAGTWIASGMKSVIYETRQPPPGGTARRLLWTVRLNYAEGGTFRDASAIGRDITLLRETEEALSRSEAMYRTLVENTPNGVVIYKAVEGGANFEVIEFNKAAEKIEGVERSSVIGRKVVDVFPGIVDLGLFEVLREVWATGQARHHPVSLYRDQRAEGWRENFVYRLPTGEVAVVYRDESDRKRAEEALRESEEKYRHVVENANDAIFIAQDGMIKFANQTTVQLTGYDPKALRTTPFTRFIHPEDRDMVLERHQRRLRGDQLENTYSFRLLREGREELWVQLSTARTTWEGRPATLNYLRDVTRLKALEAQFLHAQKMEAVGTLAGGIAHDFNNLLMGIQGRASIALIDMGASDPSREHIEAIEDYVRNATDLTKQLLGFARRGKYEMRPTDLNELVGRSATMFGRTQKEINVHTKLGASIWAVEVDRGQIEQVLLNLYVNAWQAMPSGGDLYLETRNVILDEEHQRAYGIPVGRYAKISVTDTGVGMDQKTKERVFEPFFTTKEMGRGTGLGLASAYGIVSNHGGAINVYSEKGLGATFSIYLPASSKAVEQGREADCERALARGRERILLVDDEQTVAEVGQKMLGKLGYQVIVASGGKQALELYVRESGSIDLVILDMVMPTMDGGATYEMLRGINSKVRVLLSSGYSLNGQAAEILRRGCNGFIQKPFSLEDLSQRIRELLDSPEIGDETPVETRAGR